MNRIKTISGFCPTLKKNYSINITYIDVSDLQHRNRYIQGMVDCEYGSFGNCPIMNKCPLVAKAPEEINNV